MGVQSAAEALQKLDRAHAALLRQGDLQFHMTQPVRSKPSPFALWLQHLLEPIQGAVMRLLGPLAPYVFWLALIGGLAAAAYAILAPMVMVKRGERSGGLRLEGAEEPWRPDMARSRALLQEADALAEQGLFMQAAHLILLRSIEDIQSRRPMAVAVSLTSRDIARLDALPPPARRIFAEIAAAVERTLFGGRSMDRAEFERCRSAYASFAGAGAWS